MICFKYETNHNNIIPNQKREKNMMKNLHKGDKVKMNGQNYVFIGSTGSLHYTKKAIEFGNCWIPKSQSIVQNRTFDGVNRMLIYVKEWLYSKLNLEIDNKIYI